MGEAVMGKWVKKKYDTSERKSGDWIDVEFINMMTLKKVSMNE